MKIMLKHPAKRDNKPSKNRRIFGIFLELPQHFLSIVQKTGICDISQSENRLVV